MAHEVGDTRLLPPLERGACQVWWARVGSGQTGDNGRWDGLLDHVERARAEAYHREMDRRRFVVGVGLSRLVLAGQLGLAPARVPLDRRCEQCGAPHGRPRLPGAEIGLSVSHSEEWVAVAFVRGALVGVDVESVRPALRLEHLVGSALAPAERDQLATCPDGDQPGAFLTYWTRKEAVVKATGDGLSVQLPGVVVSPPGADPVLLSYEGRTDLTSKTTLADLHPGTGYRAALAVIGEAPTSITQLAAEAVLAPA